MATAYIANKPVRFDRNYSVGEIIPEGIIVSEMRGKLVEMGRILAVTAIEAVIEPAIESAGSVGEGAAEDAPEGEPDGAGREEFICPVCGKAFKSKGALAGHSRAHKE